MMRAIRTQTDGLGNLYDRRTQLDCSVEGNKDRTHQEFKDDCDTNRILSTFGVNNQQRTTIPFGDADYTIDLQQALHSVNDAQRAYHRMEPAIRKLYPSFEKFLRGMNSGDLAKDLERLETERRPAQQTAEIREQMLKDRRRQELERDDEAARVADDVRAGRHPAKPEEKPK